MCTTVQQPRGGEVGSEFLGESARLIITIVIRKPNHPIGIRHVQELWVVAGRIKSDPEWLVQALFCKHFSDAGLAITVCIAQHLYLIRATLYNEDVAIRCGEKESRVAKATRVQVDFKPWRNFGLRIIWPVYNVRPIH